MSQLLSAAVKPGIAVIRADTRIDQLAITAAASVPADETVADIMCDGLAAAAGMAIARAAALAAEQQEFANRLSKAHTLMERLVDVEARAEDLCEQALTLVEASPGVVGPFDRQNRRVNVHGALRSLRWLRQEVESLVEANTKFQFVPATDAELRATWEDERRNSDAGPSDGARAATFDEYRAGLLTGRYVSPHFGWGPRLGFLQRRETRGPKHDYSREFLLLRLAEVFAFWTGQPPAFHITETKSKNAEADLEMTDWLIFLRRCLDAIEFPHHVTRHDGTTAPLFGLDAPLRAIAPDDRNSIWEIARISSAIPSGRTGPTTTMAAHLLPSVALEQTLGFVSWKSPIRWPDEA